jgi:hypothetical protein
LTGASVGVWICVGIAEAVGSIGAVVEVGMAVGRALVGTEVGVNATIGASSAVQAVRIIKDAVMNFFIFAQTAISQMPRSGTRRHLLHAPSAVSALGADELRRRADKI